MARAQKAVRRRARKLDTLDHAILTALQHDARASGREVAERIRAPQSTVSTRIRRLTESGVLRFVAASDMRAGGYPILALCGMRVRRPLIEEITRKVALIPEAISVVIVTGQFDIAVRFLVRDAGHLLNVLEDKLAEIRGIEALEFGLGLEVHLYGAAFRPMLRRPSSSLPVLGLDQIDTAIINTLRADAHTNLTRVAKRCGGVSESTVRFRLRRLEKQKQLRFIAEVDPEAVGVRAMSFIGFLVDFEDLTTVTETLMKIPEITSVMKTMGSYNLQATVAVKNRHELVTLLTDRLGDLPGCRSSVTSEILSVIKHDHCWTHIP